MKTRFGFFNRGCKCELCSRQICSKCSTKMTIPLEHFSQTPVLTLSPNNQDLIVEDRRFSMGSAPTSPGIQRKFATTNLTSQQLLSSSLTSFDQREVDDEYGPSSLGPKSSTSSYFQRFSRSYRSQRCHDRNDKPKNPDLSVNNQQGPVRQVCMDCKEMVLQIVRAQSTAKRLQFAKNLFTQQLMT